MRRLWLVLCWFVPSAFAQADGNSISYTASQTVSVAPDRMEFSIRVFTPLDTSLDRVLAVLPIEGIDASHLVGVDRAYYGSSSLEGLGWTFDLVVPISKSQGIVSALSAGQQSLKNDKSSLSIFFNGSGARSATDLQDYLSCPSGDLLAEARTRAQTLAALAGGTVGKILALSDGSGVGSSGVFFSVGIPGLGFAASPTFETSCRLTVKFELLRYQNP